MILCALFLANFAFLHFYNILYLIVNYKIEENINKHKYLSF